MEGCNMRIYQSEKVLMRELGLLKEVTFTTHLTPVVEKHELTLKDADELARGLSQIEGVSYVKVEFDK